MGMGTSDSTSVTLLPDQVVTQPPARLPPRM
jgi:hypothetical protein